MLKVLLVEYRRFNTSDSRERRRTNILFGFVNGVRVISIVLPLFFDFKNGSEDEGIPIVTTSSLRSASSTRSQVWQNTSQARSLTIWSNQILHIAVFPTCEKFSFDIGRNGAAASGPKHRKDHQRASATLKQVQL